MFHRQALHLTPVRRRRTAATLRTSACAVTVHNLLLGSAPQPPTADSTTGVREGRSRNTRAKYLRHKARCEKRALKIRHRRRCLQMMPNQRLRAAILSMSAPRQGRSFPVPGRVETYEMPHERHRWVPALDCHSKPSTGTYSRYALRMKGWPVYHP